MLKERLRQTLIDQAQTGNPTMYKELADRLGLEPQQTIHRIVETLEALMEDDVAAGRPMLAALCVRTPPETDIACHLRRCPLVAETVRCTTAL
jgi:hypothetical protein